MFGVYNTALWPAAALLWVVTLVVMLAFYRRRARMSRVVLVVLAIHWLWSGIVYHLMYFRVINPAATLFAGLFIVQGVLLLQRSLFSEFTLSSHATAWSRVGMALVAYSLVYPGLGLLAGLAYPRMPVFALPCPTTILTAGVLLSAPIRDARSLSVIPILWAGIGGSAAFALGIHADLGLVAAGAVLLAFVLVGPRPSVATAR